MKKIILLLFAFSTISLYSQGSKELYGKLNYSFIPHNLLNGVGYAVGYELNVERPISYKIEFGMLTTYRERPVNFSTDKIHFLDLYYNLAQMNLAFVPTWNLITTDCLRISAGLGLSKFENFSRTWFVLCLSE